jgi:hypothetical protein
MAAKPHGRHFRPGNVLRWLAWALLACSLLVVLYVRLRLLNFPLERDEGEYAYAGQLILDRIPPYKLAYNMKMPGIYLAYAAIMAVFGQTPAGIHLGLLVVHLASLVVLFLLAKRLFGLSGAAVATSAYALMTLSPAFLGLAAHATHFVVLFALLGTWMLFHFEESWTIRDCFAAGFCFGIAFLMKQPGMFFGLFGGIYLIWLCIPEGPPPAASRWRCNLAVRVGSYSLGCVLPFLAVCVWLKIAGVFPQFWFWTITYARQYASVLTLSEGLISLRKGLTFSFLGAGVLWTGAAAGLAVLCSVPMDKTRRFFLASFSVFSFLAVCPGFYFRPHYFILLLPALALLIGLAVQWSEAWFRPTPWLQLLPLVIGVVACTASLLAFNDVLFRLSPVEAGRVVQPGQPFTESLEIARYMQQHTKPNERIAVIGSEPEIYFYAHRFSSTGYIYTYPLMEPQPLAERMQAEMIHEIEQNPPAYLVFFWVGESLCAPYCSESEARRRLVKWVGEYTAKNMQSVGIIQGPGTDASEATWGTESPTGTLHSSSYVSIFKSRQR